MGGEVAAQPRTQPNTIGGKGGGTATPAHFRSQIIEVGPVLSKPERSTIKRRTMSQYVPSP